MTPEEIASWLNAMGIKKSEAAKLLGIHENTMTRWAANGAPRHVALACAALFHRMKPWGR